MNILITGGAGFVGSHLTDSLLAAGHNVTCIDDLSLGFEENLAHINDDANFQFIEQDILEVKGLAKVFASGHFDAVFHMAANSDIQQGARDRTVDLDRTFLTTFYVMEAMQEHGVKSIVFASSSAMYGDLGCLLQEDIGPLFPISFYAAAKLASEAYISAFVENFGMTAWIYRFPNVCGERTTHGAIFDFINGLEKNPAALTVLGDGTQEKPYLYVKDLVEGMLFGWANSCDAINYFNLGVDTRITVARMAEIVIEEVGLTGAEIKYTGGDRGWVGDVPKFDFDLSKINALGWKAKYTSDEAVRLSVQAELRRRTDGKISE
jgi:UDP-glucose 4-epimerase